MPKSDLSFNPDDYALVAERIALFYQQYPSGRIIPRLHAVTENAVIFEARVYRDTGDTQPAAVGWAREFENDGPINEVACLENTETSAIGRALANLGFAASKKRPSYEEMMKADRARRRLESRSQSMTAGRPISTIVARQSAASSELHARADIATDLIRRIRVAERLGLPSKRADRLIARVSDPSVSARNLARIERAMVSWLSTRNETRFRPR